MLQIVTNSGRASTLAATDAATPTLRRIERAAIAAATPITYHSRYLFFLFLVLFYNHLTLFLLFPFLYVCFNEVLCGQISGNSYSLSMNTYRHLVWAQLLLNCLKRLSWHLCHPWQPHHLSCIKPLPKKLHLCNFSGHLVALPVNFSPINGNRTQRMKIPAWSLIHLCLPRRRSHWFSQLPDVFWFIAWHLLADQKPTEEMSFWCSVYSFPPNIAHCLIWAQSDFEEC